MLPPGRRRASGMTPLTCWLALVLLFASTASAASAVLGLDFGTLNLKAVLVKPGIPLDIVLTKDSKRKETAAVAFKPKYDAKKNIVAEVGTFPERAYGGDALALQARLPGEVFPNLKPLLGLSRDEAADEAVSAYHGRYPAVQAEHVSALGATFIKSAAFADGEDLWSVDELLAMQLANVKQNAELMAGKGNIVEDVVITVPAFYTADEKRAIERAATLAGLDVIGLISDGLAVGLDYAKSRTFPEITKGEKAEHHLVFDMGAGSTTATVLRFQARSVKDVGRFNKTIQEVAVLGTGWDRTLGGDSLNNLVLADYLEKFSTKSDVVSRGIDVSDVTSNGRAMSRLWRDAEKARQVLSANTETSSSFEDLLPDVDFRAKLSRAEYEQMSTLFADRVAQPINDALTAAKLDMDDIDSVILHGGATRTPFVQRKLEELAGSSAKLRSNVNADESAVFGAAFKGAGLSPSFKVKDIRDGDIAGYPMGMRYTDGGKERKQILFSATSPVGNGASTKQVTFKDKDDFAFSLYQQLGEAELGISHVATQNLTAGVKALKEKWGCEKEEISTKFSIKLSALDGLPTIVGGTVSCEVEGSGKADSIGDSVKGWLGFGKKDQKPLSEGEEDDGPTEEVQAASPSATSEGAAAPSSKTPEKPKKRTESIPISFVVSPQGSPQPSPEEMARMRSRLTAFDRSDRARFAREEALNVLESYTYFVRDFLTNTDYSDVSTSAQRDAISEVLASTREFLESTAEVAQATEATLRARLRDLKDLVEPIQSRRKEGLGRADRTDLLKQSLDKADSLIKKMGEQIASASSKLAAASSEAAATSAPTEEASPSPTPPVAGDDLEDLEEPDSTSSSTSSSTWTPPRPSTLRDFSPYSDADLERLTDAFESATAWLAEQEEAQAALAPHEEPALRIADLDAQEAAIAALLREMQLRKTQAPPRPTVKKASSSSRAKKSSTKKASSTPAAADEQPTPAPVEEDLPVAESPPVAPLDDVVEDVPVEAVPERDEL